MTLIPGVLVVMGIRILIMMVVVVVIRSSVFLKMTTPYHTLFISQVYRIYMGNFMVKDLPLQSFYIMNWRNTNENTTVVLCSL